MSNTGKSYDDRYFDQWYRQTKLSSPARLRRKAALAVSQAEYYLERPIRSVLDIGYGEGAWRKRLLRLRRHIHYLGFDSSHYAVNRYGLQRNLHLAQIGDFSWLRPCAPVDLLVCADVLHYVATRELTRALPGLVELCNGVAFLEIFTAEDAFEGDTTGFQSRQARWYRRRFTAAGFTALGSHCWLSPVLAGHTTALEHN